MHDSISLTHNKTLLPPAELGFVFLSKCSGYQSVNDFVCIYMYVKLYAW